MKAIHVVIIIYSCGSFAYFKLPSTFNHNLCIQNTHLCLSAAVSLFLYVLSISPCAHPHMHTRTYICTHMLISIILLMCFTYCLIKPPNSRWSPTVSWYCLKTMHLLLENLVATLKPNTKIKPNRDVCSRLVNMNVSNWTDCWDKIQCLCFPLAGAQYTTDLILKLHSVQPVSACLGAFPMLLLYMATQKSHTMITSSVKNNFAVMTDRL